MSLQSLIQVRDATSLDIEAIASFQEAMALESEKMTLDPATVRRGVSEVFTNPSRGRYLVAELHEEIVGCLLLLNEWSDWRARDVVWIHSVYVLPKHRGIGVYRTMYNVVRNRVEQSSDHGGIRLYVDRTNTSAQRVYEKLGMQNDHYLLYEWMK